MDSAVLFTPVRIDKITARRGIALVSVLQYASSDGFAGGDAFL